MTDTGQLSKFEFANRDEGFDNHITKSIRHYDTLWSTIVDMSQYFVEPNTHVYDLGCSTGKLIKSLSEKNKDNAKNASYIGLDSEVDFSKNFTQIHGTSLIHGDITKWNYENCSFATSIFTLQFIPQIKRLDVLKNLYKGMNPGAGFILAEKTISEDAKIQDIMTSLYYQFKQESFSADDILTKEKKLRYLMKPNTDSANMEMLKDAGFTRIQKFWQSFQFTAYICIK